MIKILVTVSHYRDNHEITFTLKRNGIFPQCRYTAYLYTVRE